MSLLAQLNGFARSPPHLVHQSSITSCGSDLMDTAAGQRTPSGSSPASPAATGHTNAKVRATLEPPHATPFFASTPHPQASPRLPPTPHPPPALPHALLGPLDAAASLLSPPARPAHHEHSPVVRYADGETRSLKRGYSLFAGGGGGGGGSLGSMIAPGLSIFSASKRPASGDRVLFPAALAPLDLPPAPTSLYSSCDSNASAMTRITLSSPSLASSLTSSPVITGFSSAAPPAIDGIAAPAFMLDPRGFEDAHSFTQKAHTHFASFSASSTVHSSSSATDTNRRASTAKNNPFIAPLAMHHLASHALPSSLQSHAVGVGGNASTSRSRSQFKCPPTPAPKMCISVGTADLFSNKILLPIAPAEEEERKENSAFAHVHAASLAPESEDDEDEDDETIVDVHALAGFTNGPTYSSSDPFAHARSLNPAGMPGAGPFIFERHFRSHKLVGAGSFFEVFRCEKKRASASSSSRSATAASEASDASLVKLQQEEFKLFSLELDSWQRAPPSQRRGSVASSKSLEAAAAATAAAAAASSARRSRAQRVYAIKKSLKPFRNEYDRECCLREARVLDYINRTRIMPPLARDRRQASDDSGAAPAPSPHRNPHIVRSFLTWQESGFFFSRLEYALCNLDELVYMMVETPADAPVAPPPRPPPTRTTTGRPLLTILTDTPTPTGSPTPSPVPFQSYLHVHMLRVFLSVLVQLSLALHSLHAHGIVHLDVKPANVLLNRRSTRLLLSDFGFAKRLDEIHGAAAATDADATNASTHMEDEWPRATESEEGIEGDSVYMAPELLGSLPSSDHAAMSDEDPAHSDSEEEHKSPRTSSSSSRISTKVDLFSLGLLLFELLSNCQLPKSGFLWQQLRQGHVAAYLPTQEDAPHTRPRDLAWMHDVIISLLQPEPERRMSAADLLLAADAKMREMGWLPALTVTRANEGRDERIQHIVFEWTQRLPTALALPTVSQLNYASLVERARVTNVPCPTPSPPPLHTPSIGTRSFSGVSPSLLWSAKGRGLTSPASFRRQRTCSPSPSPPPFRRTLTARAGGSRGLSAREPHSAAPVTLTHVRPGHHRSVSVGLWRGPALAPGTPNGDDSDRSSSPLTARGAYPEEATPISAGGPHRLGFGHNSGGGGNCVTPILLRRSRLSQESSTSSSGASTTARLGLTRASSTHHTLSTNTLAALSGGSDSPPSPRPATLRASPPARSLFISVAPRDVGVGAGGGGMLGVGVGSGGGVRGPLTLLQGGSSGQLSPFRLNSPAKKPPPSWSGAAFHAANTATTTTATTTTTHNTTSADTQSQQVLLMSRAHVITDDTMGERAPHYRALFHASTGAGDALTPPRSPASPSLFSVLAPSPPLSSSRASMPSAFEASPQLGVAKSMFAPPSARLFAAARSVTDSPPSLHAKGSVLGLLSARLNNNNSPEMY